MRLNYWRKPRVFVITCLCAFLKKASLDISSDLLVIDFKNRKLYLVTQNLLCFFNGQTLAKSYTTVDYIKTG